MRYRLAVILLASLATLAACDDDDVFNRNPDQPPIDLPSGDLTLTAIATGFVDPVFITHAGDGSGRLFIVEQEGRVWVIEAATVQQDPFLDIRNLVLSDSSERGLLGIAFPPAFDGDAHFYVSYTSRQGATITAGESIVSRFDVSSGSVVPGSEEILLQVEQPFANHNGGQIAFGPDGYLYVALGDGGSGGDPQGNGQDPGTLLGSLLRIDVESAAAPYAIPADNPFVGDPGARDEIWAYGLRNPWRFSFDRTTGDLYLGDVGQDDYEEIDFQASASPGGENYGWNIMEGLHCYPPNISNCDQQGLTLPITEYEHAGGDCSVTGGYVYRGDEYPELQGIYLYGDFCSGRLRGLIVDDDSREDGVLLETGLNISSFGEDEDGNLYLADHGQGDIYRIEVTQP